VKAALNLLPAFIALVLALAFTPGVKASELLPTTVGLHLVSKHSNNNADWENTNPGLYAVWSNGATVGTYHNSMRRQSVYAGWSGNWPITQRVSAGITLGAITGYSRPVLPLIVPSLRVGITDHAALRLSFIVNPLKNSAHAVHVSAEWSF
jgi:hypothetical protein